LAAAALVSCALVGALGALLSAGIVFAFDSGPCEVGRLTVHYCRRWEWYRLGMWQDKGRK
jgi:hypothetical protein